MSWALLFPPWQHLLSQRWGQGEHETCFFPSVESACWKFHLVHPHARLELLGCGVPVNQVDIFHDTKNPTSQLIGGQNPTVPSWKTMLYDMITPTAQVRASPLSTDTHLHVAQLLLNTRAVTSKIQSALWHQTSVCRNGLRGCCWVANLCPMSPQTHLPRSQQKRVTSDQPAERFWADLELQCCHHSQSGAMSPHFHLPRSQPKLPLCNAAMNLFKGP